MEALFPLPPPPDLHQSFNSYNEMRVLVVPIGAIPSHKFNFYLNLISTYSEAELLEVNPEIVQSTFPNRDWKETTIKLNFEQEHEGVRHDIGSGWDTLEAHRRVLGVIGIVLCHQFPDLTEAQDQFNNIVSSYSTAIAYKCFAFEPMQDQPDLYGGSLIMVPDGDIGKLGFYVRTQLMDLTAAILHDIDSWMTKNSVEEQAAYISTSLDSIDDIDSINTLKRRKMGRLSKCKGDWCMLAGSPQDAIDNYNAAIEQTRNNSDYIWQGAAIEGYVAALVTQYKMERVELTTNQLDDVAQRIQEAITCYKKRNATNLAAEATFRLISYHVEGGRKKEASDLLMTAYELVLDMPLYNKIVVTSAIALYFQSIQYMRKFAFFIRECAVLYHKFHKPQAAHNLLSMVSKHYQLEDLDEQQSAIALRTRSPFGEASPYNIANNRRPLKDKTKRDWTYLQRL